MAPEYGGTGGAFSSTDLLAAALGSCIATNIGPVAERHGIPLDTFEIHVEKTLGQQPKWVTRLHVAIHCRSQIGRDMLDRLQRAAESCTVSRSLRPDMDHAITFVLPGS